LKDPFENVDYDVIKETHFILNLIVCYLHFLVAFISERELMFMFAICRRPTVCL